MKFLVLDISYEGSGNRQRPSYIRDALRDAGHDSVSLKWCKWNHGRKIPLPDEEVIRLLPSRTWGLAQVPVWNQRRVLARLKKIVRRRKIDAVIWPNNWYLIGYPPDKFDVPIIVDYFDLLSEDMERRYFQGDRIGLCASSEMTRRAENSSSRAYWVPTPIEVGRFQMDRISAKERIHVDPSKKVISLIGLTASRSLYFIDAVDKLRRNDIECLIVGDGELRGLIEQKINTVRHQERFHVVGKIPYELIHLYFCATDVGLYPGDDTEYYHTACPIKVLEYSAAGSMVVCNKLREVERWGLSNVIMSPPDSDSFVHAITAAITRKPTQPRITQFSKEYVSGRLQEIIRTEL